jgi:hypothetical protein
MQKTIVSTALALAAIATANSLNSTSANVSYQGTLLQDTAVNFADNQWRNDQQVFMFFEGSCQITTSCPQLTWNLTSPGMYTGPSLIAGNTPTNYIGVQGMIEWFLVVARGTEKPSPSIQEWPGIRIEFNKPIIGIQTLTTTLFELNSYLQAQNGGNDAYWPSPNAPFFGLESEFDIIHWLSPSTVEAYVRTQANEGGNWDVFRVGVFTQAPAPPEPVPEGSTMFLLGGALIGLGAYKKVTKR